MTTIQTALHAAYTALAASDTAALDAQLLLAHSLDVERAYLFAYGEQPLTAAQRRQFQAMLTRRAAGEPIAYILGRAGFYDLDFIVSPAALIPRPETELLLEDALRLIPASAAITVADIGTGSGALAIAFARPRPQCQVYATDISAAALELARRNATDNATPVNFLRGNLAQPLIDSGITVALLMANLPYIKTDELKRLPVGRYEPRLALDGGADGLRLFRALLEQLPLVCQPGATVLLEIGAEQGAAVAALARDRLGVACTISPDYAGLDRIASFCLK